MIWICCCFNLEWNKSLVSKKDFEKNNNVKNITITSQRYIIQWIVVFSSEIDIAWRSYGIFQTSSIVVGCRRIVRRQWNVVILIESDIKKSACVLDWIKQKNTLIIDNFLGTTQIQTIIYCFYTMNQFKKRLQSIVTHKSERQSSHIRWHLWSLLCRQSYRQHN